jgi:hypothetical protein
MKKILLIVILTTCAALDARADDRVAKLEARIQQLELRVQKLEALLTLAEAFPPNSLPPKGSPTNAKPVGNSRDVANWRRIKRGMTIDQLIAILGKPTSVTIISDNELWFYKGKSGLGSVSLDKNDRVQRWSSP